MTRVAIVAAQTVTAAGRDLDATWAALMDGKTAIRPVARFPTASYHSRVAALIDDLSPHENHALVFSLLERLWGRLAEETTLPGDALLFTASAKGGIDQLEAAQRGLPSRGGEATFAAMIDFVRERTGIEDRGVNVSAACASSTVALAQAAAALASGRAHTALVVGADIITEFVFSGFSSLLALSPAPCRPFDAGRDGLSLGEGAAALVLTTQERAEREGLRPLAYLTGWGAANDATHITAPARDGCGLIEASRRALARAGVREADVGGILAHGTGTVFNDAMELAAFRTLFGDDAPPLAGAKGALGHTMGAAGAIEAALCVRALGEGVLPPTVGLSTPEPSARGWAGAHPLPLRKPRLLSTNSGFGGINAALVLEGAGA